MGAVPLQIIDSFLLNYNAGDALLVLFALGILAVIPLKSWKILLLHFLTFGLLFVLTPSSALAVDPGGSHLLGNALHYKLVGLALIVLSPVLYATTD
ncbi:MAG: hypothetical protein ABEH64_03110 [Salinirussus sp.]